MNRLSVATAFSRTPGSRYPDEGEFSGEEFRTAILAPAVRAAVESGEALTVDLDGTAGYGTSFLEEAFGGLIREDGLTEEQLRRALRIKSDEEDYLVDDVLAYIADAQRSVLLQSYARA